MKVRSGSVNSDAGIGFDTPRVDLPQRCKSFERLGEELKGNTKVKKLKLKMGSEVIRQERVLEKEGRVEKVLGETSNRQMGDLDMEIDKLDKTLIGCKLDDDDIFDEDMLLMGSTERMDLMNTVVVLGGGRRHWLPKVATDPQSTKDEGRRLDGRNLMEDWLRDRKRRGIPAEYVWNKTQLDNVSPLHTDHLLALDETLQLETALLAVMSLVNQTETLFVVTSDHSHVMTLGGLSTSRGNPILGVRTSRSKQCLRTWPQQGRSRESVGQQRAERKPRLHPPNTHQKHNPVLINTNLFAQCHHVTKAQELRIKLYML
ncbi:unnamed protein product [Bemisia tabaci]|uniref:alkaline phosphatase n=1 Tax=Bemisia tabaci TaxID=7038 RepID=A0A9P0FA69_BEMTA|nr:unnamed protein product [Bemisia tabaci]